MRLQLLGILIAALLLAGCGQERGAVHGLVGSAIVSTTAEPGNQGLSTRKYNLITATSDLAFAVTINNSGDVRERNVKVTLAIEQKPVPIVQAKRINLLDPGEEKTLIFRNLGQPEFATTNTLQVEIAPVPGEENLTNNSAKYLVIFALGDRLSEPVTTRARTVWVKWPSTGHSVVYRIGALSYGPVLVYLEGWRRLSAKWTLLSTRYCALQSGARAVLRRVGNEQRIIEVALRAGRDSSCSPAYYVPGVLYDLVIKDRP